MSAWRNSCYVMGSMLLGPEPSQSRLPTSQQSAAPTYASLGALDAFSNLLVPVENIIIAPEPPLALVHGTGQTPSLPITAVETRRCCSAFRRTTSCWRTGVRFAQRLYNIRHCLNLQGVAQPLPLYAPPINPLAAHRRAAERCHRSGRHSARADLPLRELICRRRSI